MLFTNRMNNLFDEMLNDPFFTRHTWFDNSQMMKTDVQEKDGNYIIDMELPGYAKEDIQAELKDGYLTITANRDQQIEQKEEQSSYIRRERYTGTCKRSFFVGKQVKQEEIKAAFKDGILRIAVPKEKGQIEEKSNYIAIE